MAKILLADDSTHAQRMGAKILAAEGHQVTTVSNGQAAIHSLEEAAPDLIVADVFMPGRNGYEVCHFVKSDDRLKNIPVLLIIGAMEPYDPEEGKRAGADGLITKPLESSSLVATVEELLSAAQRFAPARAKRSKQAAAEEAAEEVSQVEEPPKWEEEPEEVITSVPEPKFEIPQGMGQQPIGMLTDFMDILEAPPMESAPVEMAEAVSETMAEPPSLPPQARTSHLDLMEQTVWTAEPAEMTPEEEKLFEQPSADWGDLAQLVEQGGPELKTEAMTAPAIPPDVPPMAMYSEPAAPVSEAAEDSPVEYFSSLDDVVAAPPMQAPHVEVPSMAPEPAPLEMEVAGSEEEEAASTAAPEALAEAEEEITAAPMERNMPPIEQLVRQAVEDLLPDIIERVKQSLKN